MTLKRQRKLVLYSWQFSSPPISNCHPHTVHDRYWGVCNVIKGPNSIRMCWYLQSHFILSIIVWFTFGFLWLSFDWYCHLVCVLMFLKVKFNCRSIHSTYSQINAQHSVSAKCRDMNSSWDHCILCTFTYCGFHSCKSFIVWLYSCYIRECMKVVCTCKNLLICFLSKLYFLMLYFEQIFMFSVSVEACAYLCMCRFVCTWVYMWGAAYLSSWKQTAGCPSHFLNSRHALILILAVIAPLLWSVVVVGWEVGGGGHAESEKSTKLPEDTTVLCRDLLFRSVES